MTVRPPAATLDVMTLIRISRTATLVVALALGTGCSKPATTPSGQTTVFKGTVAASGGQTGTIVVTIQAVVPMPVESPTSSVATATLHLAGGATSTLSGTFDGATSVTLSGSGYALAGTIESGRLSGTFTASGGSGGFSTLNTASGTVTTYCGTYGPSFYEGPPANPPGGEFGTFNLQISATGAVSGVGVSQNVANDPGFVLTGQLSGSTLTLSTFDLSSHHATGTFTATLQNNNVTASCGSGCSVAASVSACQ